MSVNPKIGKQKPNGSIQCLVCNIEVKAKIWTAHVNGKKHRDCIVKLKQAVNAPKRPTKDALKEEPASKRAKEEEENAGGSAIPSDFFDEKPRNLREKVVEDKPAGVIDGVPQGFFDDKQMDDKVVETREKNAILDEEFEKWKQEISEEQIEMELKKEETEAEEMRRLELERIDEQMEELRRLNELEIEKEKRLKIAMQRRKQKEEEQAMEEDDDNDDFDVNIDWRAKDIFA